MQLLFIDESGTPPPVEKTESSPFFVLGGVIIPDESWHALRDKMEQVKREFAVQGEIKWRNFFTPENRKKSKNSLEHLCNEEKDALRTRLFDTLVKSEFITTICVVVDTAAAYALAGVNSPDKLYERAYKKITERFQYYLQEVSTVAGKKVNGLVVCDHRNRDDDHRLREFHNNLLSGRHSACSNYRNLVEGVFIAPSHLSVGIQFADMVAGAVLRLVKNDDRRFYDRISRTFHTSEKGELDGYGLVWIPAKK